MEAHDLICSTHKLATNEHRGDGGIATDVQQSLLDFPTEWDLVELVHGRVHPEVVKECPNAMADATLALAKYDDGFFGHHDAYPLH